MLVKLTDIDCFEHSGNEGPNCWVVTRLAKGAYKLTCLVSS